ncbi:MAG: hypothetical protein EXS31_01810 [Pedosphaera sp.]|nr:hypothetical protein [Pedosphaera sp.]
MKKQFALLLLLLAFSVSAKATEPPCGITIITHGYQGPIYAPFPQWVRIMAEAITNRIGASIPIYTVRFEPLTSAFIPMDRATNDDLGRSGSAIILLDWSEVSWITTTSTRSVADHFFDFLFGRAHNNHSLAELPIHLIGHSRGASLNTRLAYRLANSGILIDQVTTLDPHPVELNGNDEDMATYWNVVFADNYWRHGVAPQGDPVDGAFNVPLDDEFDGLGDPQGFLVTEHQAVHTYYYGTINTAASDDGDTPVLTWPWFTSQGVTRSTTGFAYSRYARSADRPAANAGIRTSFSSPVQLWPNAYFDQRTPITDHITVGQQHTFDYHFSDRSSELDSDRFKLPF